MAFHLQKGWLSSLQLSQIKEMQNPQKVQRMITYYIGWFKSTFKGFKVNVEIVLWKPVENMCENW